MRTRQWDSLPIEKLNELLREAQAIHGGLAEHGRSRAGVVIEHIRSLIDQKESEKRHLELQERLSAMHAVLDRSEKLAGRFEQQMDKLLTVVERQMMFAEKLDRLTRHLVGLTYVLVILTITLVAFAIKEILR